MAKQTTLQIVNKILNNLGETTVSNLGGLSGISMMIFNVINELLYDIALEYRYKPLEKGGTITLTSGTATYAKPSDLMDYDRKSFKYNRASEIVYYSAQRFDREHVEDTKVGKPQKFLDFANYFQFYCVPGADENAKSIRYRYWQNPTPLETATPAGTCWLPEGFELTLLSDYVTYKILHYKGNPEAQFYYVKVFGDGRGQEGSLSKLKSIWGSPDLKESNIVDEPMENSGTTKFQQQAIVG